MFFYHRSFTNIQDAQKERPVTIIIIAFFTNAQDVQKERPIMQIWRNSHLSKLYAHKQMGVVFFDIFIQMIGAFKVNISPEKRHTTPFLSSSTKIMCLFIIFAKNLFSKLYRTTTNQMGIFFLLQILRPFHQLVIDMNFAKKYILAICRWQIWFDIVQSGVCTGVLRRTAG